MNHFTWTITQCDMCNCWKPTRAIKTEGISGEESRAFLCAECKPEKDAS